MTRHVDPCRRRAIAVPLLLALSAGASPAPVQNAPDERRAGQLLRRHCARCHNPRLANAGIDLSGFEGALEIILRRLEEEGWGGAAMIREIVLSDPYRFRRGDLQ